MGTVSQEATAGTQRDSEASEPPVRFRGDELDLYAEFHHELLRKLQANIHCAPEDIDDAASFAWVQFFRHQPDRDGQWKGWLFRTAQREAWRLNAEHGRANLRIVSEAEAPRPGTTREPQDPRDRLDERLEFLAAMQELSTLPKNLRRVVLVNSQSSRHRDVAEVLGISRSRVAQLMQQVGVLMQQRAEIRAEFERPVANPRAARLHELETNPPDWLRGAIGLVPTINKSSSKAILAWRRAAIAIDDYRTEHGWHHAELSIGPTPIDPAARRAHVRVARAIDQVREERVLRKGGHERER